MASNITVNINVQGTSELSGPIGPFATQLVFTAQAFAQRLEATILPSDVDKIVTIPTVGTQSFIMVKTGSAVSFKINAETVARSIGAAGVYMLSGQPNHTQLLFTGNGSSVSAVSIIVIGT